MEPGTVAIAFRNGSPEAVRAVQERVHRIVWFRGYRMPEQDKKDLEQEIVTQIWQAASAPGFEAGDRFWGFVEVVSGRRCIDWVRAQMTRGPETEIAADLPAPTPGAVRATLAREQVELALTQLKKPCRELIYHRLALGHTYAELAAIFAKSEGALRVQLHRCVERARLALGGEAAEPPVADAKRIGESR